MAKKSIIAKQGRKPKYSTRAYSRCKICGRPHAYLRKYGICRICFRELAYKAKSLELKKPAGNIKRRKNMFTDPIADMLTRIRNANNAKHSSVEIPASNVKKSLAQILLDEGYINGYNVTEGDVQGTITVDLKYGPNEEKVISGIKRISKPGLRVYVRKDEVPKVLGGLGIAIISTSKGIVTDKSARELGVGGEVICYVW